MIRTLLIIFCLSLTALFLQSCGGATDVSKLTTSEERFRAGMQAMAKGDYLTARQLFETIRLQDPASEYADDAQYYLAESYYLNEEYKLAAFEYNRLRSQFSTSPFFRLALFKAGESYMMGAPPYDRDQHDTKVAIEQFRAFLDFYPNDSLSQPAKARIFTLRNRLAQKDFAAAEQYVKIAEFRAAIIYFDKVIDEYQGTDYYGPAIVGKVNALVEQERTADALAEVKKYLAESINETTLNQLKKLEQDLSK